MSTLARLVRISIICGGICGWRSPAAACALIHSTTCACASASVSSPLTAAASAAVMSRLKNATSESSGAGPGSSGASPFSAEALVSLERIERGNGVRESGRRRRQGRRKQRERSRLENFLVADLDRRRRLERMLRRYDVDRADQTIAFARADAFALRGFLAGWRGEFRRLGEIRLAIEAEVERGAYQREAAEPRERDAEHPAQRNAAALAALRARPLDLDRRLMAEFHADASSVRPWKRMSEVGGQCRHGPPGQRPRRTSRASVVLATAIRRRNSALHANRGASAAGVAFSRSVPAEFSPKRGERNEYLKNCLTPSRAFPISTATDGAAALSGR